MASKMKLKILNVLTVCLLTLVVLSPALVVISVVWKYHLDFMATRHLLYAVTNSQQLATHGENATVRILLQLMLFTPIGLGLGIAVYDRYVIYRAAALNRQIAKLERLWQQNNILEGDRDETDSGFNFNSDCWDRSYRN